jgi:hypothetical protein
MLFQATTDISDCPFMGLCEAVDLPGSAQPESTHVLQVEIRTATDHERQQETDPLDELLQCLPADVSFAVDAIYNATKPKWKDIDPVRIRDGISRRIQTLEETDRTRTLQLQGRKLIHL